MFCEHSPLSAAPFSPTSSGAAPSSSPVIELICAHSAQYLMQLDMASFCHGNWIGFLFSELVVIRDRSSLDYVLAGRWDSLGGKKDNNRQKERAPCFCMLNGICAGAMEYPNFPLIECVHLMLLCGRKYNYNLFNGLVWNVKKGIRDQSFLGI